MTFIDDKSRYIWIYMLKYKNEIFNKFLEMKAMVEEASGKEVETLRSDNGGEYLEKLWRLSKRSGNTS